MIDEQQALIPELSSPATSALIINSIICGIVSPESIRYCNESSSVLPSFALASTTLLRMKYSFVPLIRRRIRAGDGREGKRMVNAVEEVSTSSKSLRTFARRTRSFTSSTQPTVHIVSPERVCKHQHSRFARDDGLAKSATESLFFVEKEVDALNTRP